MACPLGASLVAQLVKNLPAMQETPIWFLGREDPLEKGQAATVVFLGFAGGSASKESTCNVGDLGLIPGLGRSPGEGNSWLSTPVFWSVPGDPIDVPGDPMDGIAEESTQLSDFHFPFSCSLHLLRNENVINQCWYVKGECCPLVTEQTFSACSHHV